MAQLSAPLAPTRARDAQFEAVDPSAKRRPRRRGWLVRRLLLAGDVFGLALTFAVAETVAFRFGWRTDLGREAPLFLASLPLWVVVAKIYGLYDRDEERAHHSTVDEIVNVFHLLTTGVWLLAMSAWAFGVFGIYGVWLRKAVLFWLLAIVIVPATRATARAVCRRLPSYRQRTVIVGAGDMGQLIARKLVQHPEYAIDLVGFVDGDPKEVRSEVEHLPVLGGVADLPKIVRTHGVDRVLVAFSGDSNHDLLGAIRALAEPDIQVDVVPRLYELVAPNVDVHTLEGIPLIGLPPAKLSRSSRLLKRSLDLVGASLALLVSAPLFIFIALWIRRDSRGPVLFRQERVGQGMRPFTVLKFRTMQTNVDESAHRDYIQATMDTRAAPGGNGLYKLDRTADVTRAGRWLRKTSLDELPQLLNVLRGDMSLVGPRPCLAYETEYFEPHHFERFLAKPGLTGLWQVTARAKSTFAEALDMDVAYVRGWSFGLDLALLCRTPLQLIRPSGTA